MTSQTSQETSADTSEAMMHYQRQLLEHHFRNVQRFHKSVEVHHSWEPNVGQTPHDVVYTEGKARLLHYKPQGEKRYKTPLLIVFSLINRSYVLDLKPGKSIVEKMIQEGYDVYLIDWGVAGPADQYLTLDDYINRYMYRMAEYVKEHADVDKINLMGYCMGGTMTGMYAALYPESVKNLILLAAPFDFSDKEGLLSQWAGKEYFNVEKLVDTLGNIPPWFLQSSFLMLKPMQNMVDKYVKFFEKVEDDAFVDDFMTLEYWLNDNVPLAGPVYKQFVTDCFHDNLLIKNKMKLGDDVVDLRKITCPTLSIVAEHDHLVSPVSSLKVNEVIGSKEKKAIEFASGHIGLSVSSRAMRDLWPTAAEWLGKNSEPINAKINAQKPAPEKPMSEKPASKTAAKKSNKNSSNKKSGA